MDDCSRYCCQHEFLLRYCSSFHACHEFHGRSPSLLSFTDKNSLRGTKPEFFLDAKASRGWRFSHGGAHGKNPSRLQCAHRGSRPSAECLANTENLEHEKGRSMCIVVTRRKQYLFVAQRSRNRFLVILQALGARSSHGWMNTWFQVTQASSSLQLIVLDRIKALARCKAVHYLASACFRPLNPHHTKARVLMCRWNAKIRVSVKMSRLLAQVMGSETGKSLSS
jgi:hypothetical protein